MKPHDSLQTTQRIRSFCPFFCNCLLEWLVEGDTFLVFRVLCGDAVVLVFSLRPAIMPCPDLPAEGISREDEGLSDLPFRTCHYTWNTNLELTADSILSGVPAVSRIRT